MGDVSEELQLKILIQYNSDQAQENPLGFTDYVLGRMILRLKDMEMRKDIEGKLLDVNGNSVGTFSFFEET